MEGNMKPDCNILQSGSLLPPQVKILRRESYWYNGIGSVVAVDQVNC